MPEEPRARKAKRNRAIFQDFQGGETAQVLAQRFGVSVQRVLQIVDDEAARLGVQHRPGLRRGGKQKVFVPDHLTEAYRERRLGASDIAALLGCAEGTVRVHLREVRRVPRVTKFQRVYADYKTGMKIRELAEKYGVSGICVCQFICRGRAEDPEPYYRYRRRARSSTRRNGRCASTAGSEVTSAVVHAGEELTVDAGPPSATTRRPRG